MPLQLTEGTAITVDRLLLTSAAGVERNTACKPGLTVTHLGSLFWPVPLVMVGLSPLMDHVSGNGVCEWPFRLRCYKLLEVWVRHKSSRKSSEGLGRQAAAIRSLQGEVHCA